MSKSHRKASQPEVRPVKGQPTMTLDLLIGLGLILAIFAIYADVGRFEFTIFDDNLYVTENAHVQAGLTLDSLKWALTAVVSSNWMPVTLFSHMLDCQLFHLQSGMHHLVNVLFHMLASVLLFVVLKRATGARWPSAFVAFVFAVHPLHVESVAWVAERKDVLSTCLLLLALYAYLRYAEQPTLRRYLLVATLFCLGLMAKPMLVTFPFILLLFDLWPLRRMQFPRILWEKIPLVALSAVASVMTFYVQRSSGSINIHNAWYVRVENALISYVVYLGQTFWPTGLAALYPYEQSFAVWQVAGAFVLLLGVTVLVIREWRTRPYLATGWFWYLGTLVPVIGLVQVGLQSRADRYMYIPMIGLLLMLAWGAVDVLARWPQAKTGIVVAAGVSGIACLLLSHAQLDYWQNSGTLFQRAIDVTHDNYVAQYNLGNYLMNVRRGPEAIPHFEAALRIKPDYPEAESNLGMVLGGMPGRMADAIPHFEAAVRLRPALLEAHYNLALALSQVGRTQEAISQYEIVQRAQPSPELAKIIDGLRAGQK